MRDAAPGGSWVTARSWYRKQRPGAGRGAPPDRLVCVLTLADGRVTDSRLVEARCVRPREYRVGVCRTDSPRTAIAALGATRRAGGLRGARYGAERQGRRGHAVADRIPWGSNDTKAVRTRAHDLTGLRRANGAPRALRVSPSGAGHGPRATRIPALTGTTDRCDLVILRWRRPCPARPRIRRRGRRAGWIGPASKSGDDPGGLGRRGLHVPRETSGRGHWSASEYFSGTTVCRMMRPPASQSRRKINKLSH